MCLLDGIDDPKEAWEKLYGHCKKMWANKFELWKKLHNLRMKGGSVQEHIRQMTDLFRGLAEMDLPLTEEDKVVYLLASLPESFGVLVTALEASHEVATMDVVTERLLHEERKRGGYDTAVEEKALTLTGKHPRKKGPCHHCGKMGHYKRDCWKLAGKKAEPQKEDEGGKDKTSLVTELSGLTDDAEVLVVSHALSIGSSCSWIVNLGNVSHVYLKGVVCRLQQFPEA